MMALDPDTAAKLAKLCGMLGSDHVGERAAAAAKADELVRRHGLTWPQVIIPEREPVEDLIAFAVAHGEGIIDEWEWGFLRGVAGRGHYLSRKQLSRLDVIVGKVLTWRAAQ